MSAVIPLLAHSKYTFPRERHRKRYEGLFQFPTKKSPSVTKHCLRCPKTNKFRIISVTGGTALGHISKKPNEYAGNNIVQDNNKPLILFKISGPAWGTISKTALISFTLSSASK